MKDNNKKIFLGVIVVATLIIAIVGATFAFFSSSGGSANNAVTANATTLSNLGFVSSHSKIATNLVPVSSESPYFSRYPGIASSGEHSCLDDLGNQICSIYEFTVTNTASVAQTIYVSFVPSENTFDNMYFAAFNTTIASANYVVATGSTGTGNSFSLTPQTTSGNSTLGHQATKLTKNNINAIDMPGLSTTLSVGSSVTYTILVWLQETGVTQNIEQGGIFKAGVNVTTGGTATGVTGTMGESDNSYYVYTVSSTSASIGQPIPSGMVTYDTAASAMANFNNNPFYLKHKVTNNVWCIVGSDESNSCDYGYYHFTASSCYADLQNAPDNGVTYDCEQQQINGNGVISESYVEFVITPEMASANSGMTPGTYSLKYASNFEEVNENTDAMTLAFGASNCRSYDMFYQCGISNFDVNIVMGPGGDIDISLYNGSNDNLYDHGFRCSLHNMESSCEEW